MDALSVCKSDFNLNACLKVGGLLVGGVALGLEIRPDFIGGVGLVEGGSGLLQGGLGSCKIGLALANGFKGGLDGLALLIQGPGAGIEGEIREGDGAGGPDAGGAQLAEAAAVCLFVQTGFFQAGRAGADFF